jgi:aryl-alcohol dehydrogenase-like predicted oxidoreductase
MNYRRLANTEISEVSLDLSGMRLNGDPTSERCVGDALEAGVNLIFTLRPEETSELGRALKSLGARRNTLVAAGIENFFAAFSRHKMRLEEFLKHELEDRLERLESTYLDCFVIDLGRGRAANLQAVRGEGISSSDNGKATPLETFEGGTFLHETMSDCLTVLDVLSKDGRVRFAALTGENVDAVKRVLVKHGGFHAAFVPYSYGFRGAEEELLPIAAEMGTAIVAIKPLWWVLRDIPVTVLAESPYPRDKASAGARADALALAADRWPINQEGVSSVAVEASDAGSLKAAASAEEGWTRADEEALRPAARIAEAHSGLFLALSAMNSEDALLRAHGWAALLKMTPSLAAQFDPEAPAKERLSALEEIAAQEIPPEPPPAAEDLDELP